MMGLRGVRLSISMPEIVEMQVRAIFEAAADCTLRGIKVKPEVMIPLTGTVKELEWIQPRLERIAKQVMEEKKVKFDLQVRHHDRDPARRCDRRPDRHTGRVLLLRHQRPDPDDLRLLAATMPSATSSSPIVKKASSPRIPSRPLTATAWAS
jgi:hypothetical protein